MKDIKKNRNRDLEIFVKEIESINTFINDSKFLQDIKKDLKVKEAVHNKLDYLRLCFKDILFNLEATERENAYLRRMLEEDTNNEGGLI